MIPPRRFAGSGGNRSARHSGGETMHGEWLSGSSFLLVSAALVYIVIVQALSKRDARPRRLSEAEMLAKLALMENRSEYDLFHIAAVDWHAPRQRVDDDFKAYLTDGILPYYVNAHVRKKRRQLGDVFSPPFSLRGRGSMPWLR